MIKIKIFIFFLIFISSLQAIKISDVRFGFYANGEKIKSDIDAEQIRCVIEFDKVVEYSVLEESDRIKLIIPSTKIEKRSEYFSNKIFQSLTFLNNNNKTYAEFELDDEFSHYVVRSINNPFRLIFDFYRTKKDDRDPLHREIKPRINKLGAIDPQTTLALSNMPGATIPDHLLNNLFIDDNVLFLDLYDVPIKQVLRFFSKQAQKDILPDQTVKGSVSLNIKNQTLSQAFKAMLESEGYTILERNNSILVTKSVGSTAFTENTYYSVYLNEISTEDMKLILDYFVPSKKIVIPNTKINKLDVFIPKAYIPLVDSLVAKYDAKAPRVLSNAKIVFLPKKSQILQNEVSVMNKESWHKVEKQKVSEIELRPIMSEIHENKLASYIHKKNIKKRRLFSQSMPFEIGTQIGMQFHISKKSFLECDIDVIWKNVFDKEVQIQSEISDEVTLDFDEMMIIPFPDLLKNEVLYERFLPDETAFYDSKEIVPYLILKPEILR